MKLYFDPRWMEFANQNKHEKKFFYGYIRLLARNPHTVSIQRP